MQAEGGSSRDSPRLAGRPGALEGREARGAGVYEGRAVALLVDLLEVDDELRGVVLRVREDLGAEERDDVVRDDLDGLVAEVGVVDAELRVKPVYFVRDELAGDEALGRNGRRSVIMDQIETRVGDVERGAHIFSTMFDVSPSHPESIYVRDASA